MKTILSIFLISLSLSNSFAQDNTINGTYHLMDAEKGVGNKPTKTKLFQYGERNGTKMLLVAACEKCMPAVYTYQKDDSENLGFPVYFNNMGFMVFTYDKDSFVMIMPDPNADNWSDFYFSNFYSKNKSKASTMTKEKIKAYVEGL